MTDNDLTQARVLVVEDDGLMRNFIVEVLQSAGFENLSTALDGIEAWRQFDLVICDWIMPGMDGLDVLKNIRNSHRAIPFILVTVQDTEEAVRQAADNGVTAFLAKPFEPEHLISEVLRTLVESDVMKPEMDSEVWEI